MTERIQVATIPELSRRSGLSEYTIRSLCRSGRLPFLDLSNRWVVKISDFEALFQTKNECAEVGSPAHSSTDVDTPIITEEVANHG